MFNEYGQNSQVQIKLLDRTILWCQGCQYCTPWEVMGFSTKRLVNQVLVLPLNHWTSNTTNGYGIGASDEARNRGSEEREFHYELRLWVEYQATSAVVVCGIGRPAGVHCYDCIYTRTIYFFFFFTFTFRTIQNNMLKACPSIFTIPHA